MQTFNSLNSAEKAQVRILQEKWGGSLEGVAQQFVQVREQRTGGTRQFTDPGTRTGIDPAPTLTAAEEAGVQRMAATLGKDPAAVRQTFTDVKSNRARGRVMTTQADLDAMTFSDGEIREHLSDPTRRQVYAARAQRTGESLEAIATQQMRLDRNGIQTG